MATLHSATRTVTHKLARAARHRACLPLNVPRNIIRLQCRRQTVASAGRDGNNQQGDDGDGPSTSGDSSSSSSGIPAVLLLLVSSAAYTVTSLRDELGDLLAGDGDLSDVTLAGLGLGDLAGALVWSLALWYASPLQLLLVFLGKIDTERPSDWLMYNIGRATGLRVNDVDYAAPGWVAGAAAGTCLGGGLAIAALLSWSLGDPTWSISSGIGALFAAAVFEAGRPQRLSVDEAKQLEAQWQDFAAFADAKLQRSGRCHESEVFAAFRRTYGRYRSPEALPDTTLRDMVRNWHPGVERTRMGYLKNISLQAPPSSSSSVRDREAVAVGSRGSSEASSGSALLDSIAEAAAEGSSGGVQQDGSRAAEPQSVQQPPQ